MKAFKDSSEIRIDFKPYYHRLLQDSIQQQTRQELILDNQFICKKIEFIYPPPAWRHVIEAKPYFLLTTNSNKKYKLYIESDGVLYRAVPYKNSQLIVCFAISSFELSNNPGTKTSWFFGVVDLAKLINKDI